MRWQVMGVRPGSSNVGSGQQAPAVDCDQRGWPANMCESDVGHALAGCGRAAHTAACSVAHDRA